MDDPVKDAWNEVAEGFSNLGQAMKHRYRGADQEHAGASGSDAGDAGLREAFERLMAAGRDVGQRAVDVAHDAEVNEQAQRAAASLNDALSATVEMIARDVAGWFGRAQPPAAEPTVGGEPTDGGDATPPGLPDR
jgi:hypothetical protein